MTLDGNVATETRKPTALLTSNRGFTSVYAVVTFVIFTTAAAHRAVFHLDRHCSSYVITYLLT